MPGTRPGMTTHIVARGVLKRRERIGKVARVGDKLH
jgi:hypothetical protein